MATKNLFYFHSITLKVKRCKNTFIMLVYTEAFHSTMAEVECLLESGNWEIKRTDRETRVLTNTFFVCFQDLAKKT